MRTYRNVARQRRGHVVPLAAILMVSMLGLVAFSVDVGYLCLARSELQRTADAAAMAGAGALYQPHTDLNAAYYSIAPDPMQARLEARSFAQQNDVTGRSMFLATNVENDVDGDIVLGRLYVPGNRSETLDLTPDVVNSVRAVVRMNDDHQNGTLPLFFGRVLGLDRANLQATATATVYYPALLPFATSTENWGRLEQGGIGDNFGQSEGSVSFGISREGDGIPEIVMFPGNWDGTSEMPPGNFGLINIGPEGSELTNLRRQIDMGPSQSDLEFHGGTLRGGDSIEGRTGLKSAAKHALLGGHADARDFAGMLGELRTLPLYDQAQGNGSNAVFRLAGFAVVRIMSVRIDARWRYTRNDTEGNEITGIIVQPVPDPSSYLAVRLVR